MPSPPWRQVAVTANPRALAATVAPELDHATNLGLVHTWWYIRKTEWRIRFRAETASYATLTDTLNRLAARRVITAWHPGIYEPETLAFGGATGMDVAHRLFHIDSTHLLARTRQQNNRPSEIGIRELTIMLCGLLLRGAGLDQYEQADVWAKVIHERPPHLAEPALHHPDDRERLARKMTSLLAADPWRLCRPGRPLAGYKSWLTGFEEAGRTLATHNRTGQLDRGLRAVLAHHIIFHANRAGLTTTDLATTAALIVTATFGFGAVAAAAARSPASESLLGNQR